MRRKVPWRPIDEFSDLTRNEYAISQTLADTSFFYVHKNYNELSDNQHWTKPDFMWPRVEKILYTYWAQIPRLVGVTTSKS